MIKRTITFLTALLLAPLVTLHAVDPQPGECAIKVIIDCKK
jgi:hypothetical protein